MGEHLSYAPSLESRDHLWLRRMPNLMVGQQPAAFPFFYLEPAKKDFKDITGNSWGIRCVHG